MNEYDGWHSLQITARPSSMISKSNTARFSFTILIHRILKYNTTVLGAIEIHIKVI